MANTTTILEAVDRLSGSIKPDAEKLAAALRVVAYALPVQEGVQWALDCFDAMDAQSQDQLDSVAIESARAWLESKNSESIERARMAAERCESTSSAKWIAQAVAWSVGCQQESETTDAHTDDENQSADTPVWLIQRIDTHRRTASAIAACVLVLSLVGDASTVDVRARQFLQSATPRFQSLIASGT
ncbi:MAG: hypothetical protein KDB00_24315 [Planctomycetales bacterium]|nr:hypothetical protein [Planctomycetales bacterium]